jgi:hypothetical protein
MLVALEPAALSVIDYSVNKRFLDGPTLLDREDADNSRRRRCRAADAFTLRQTERSPVVGTQQR